MLEVEPTGQRRLARSIRLSVQWRNCLGYRHAGCLQLSCRRPSEMCGLRTGPRTDVDPPRFLPPSNCHRRGPYRLAAPGAIACSAQKSIEMSRLPNRSIIQSRGSASAVTSRSRRRRPIAARRPGHVIRPRPSWPRPPGPH